MSDSAAAMHTLTFLVTSKDLSWQRWNALVNCLGECHLLSATLASSMQKLNAKQSQVSNRKQVLQNKTRRTLTQWSLILQTKHET